MELMRKLYALSLLFLCDEMAEYVALECEMMECVHRRYLSGCWCSLIEICACDIS